MDEPDTPSCHSSDPPPGFCLTRIGWRDVTAMGEVFYREIFADLPGKERQGKKFCFSLFETAEICFGSIKIGIFYRQKTNHASGKKSGEVTLPLLKNIPLMPLIGCMYIASFCSRWNIAWSFSLIDVPLPP